MKAAEGDPRGVAGPGKRPPPSDRLQSEEPPERPADGRYSRGWARSHVMIARPTPMTKRTNHYAILGISPTTADLGVAVMEPRGDLVSWGVARPYSKNEDAFLQPNSWR